MSHLYPLAAFPMSGITSVPDETETFAELQNNLDKWDPVAYIYLE